MRSLPRPLFVSAALALLCALSACATPEGGSSVGADPSDPYEATNRKIHAFNLAVDQTLFGPAAKGYSGFIPDPIENSFNSFADNLTAPADTVNFLFQGNFEEAGISLARFLLNSTVGFAGLADPATEFGIPHADTDFGETLYVWGVPEGAYVELPFYGPSNQRDAVGVLTDFFTNPISFAPQRPLQNIGTYSGLLERLSDRGKYADTIDSILYQSADSYAVAKVIFQQNRRFELEGSSGGSYVDPYDDPYGDGSLDPYADPYGDAATGPVADTYVDPYEDPYAE